MFIYMTNYVCHEIMFSISALSCYQAVTATIISENQLVQESSRANAAQGFRSNENKRNRAANEAD